MAYQLSITDSNKGTNRRLDSPEPVNQQCFISTAESRFIYLKDLRNIRSGFFTNFHDNDYSLLDFQRQQQQTISHGLPLIKGGQSFTAGLVVNADF